MKSVARRQELAREARQALEPLRMSPVTVGSEEENRRTRAAALPGLEAMIKAVPRQRARKRGMRVVRNTARTAVACVAAAAAMLVWTQRSPQGEGSGADAGRPQLVLTGGAVTEDGRALTIGNPYPIDGLGRLHTAEQGGARLTAGGVQLRFAARSTADLAFAGKTRRVALNRGEVALEVPPLEEGTTLSVTTPDAVVTVHGTRFSVSYRGDGTCVRVAEGVVSVVRGAQRARLTAGQQSGCHAPSGQGPQAAPEAQPARDDPRIASRYRSRQAKPATGTLTRENALFRRALSAEQERDLPAAESSLRQLLGRYPASPLAGEAQRVLGRVRAARRAEQDAPLDAP